MQLKWEGDQQWCEKKYINLSNLLRVKIKFFFFFFLLRDQCIQNILWSKCKYCSSFLSDLIAFYLSSCHLHDMVLVLIECSLIIVTTSRARNLFQWLHLDIFTNADTEIIYFFTTNLFSSTKTKTNTQYRIYKKVNEVNKINIINLEV